MAYLVSFAVFLLCLHSSACEVSDFRHQFPVIKLDRDRSPPTELNNFYNWLYNVTDGLDNKTCKTANITGPTKPITGPAYLVTDGHTNLTIYCPVMDSVVIYEWFTPCGDTQRCNTDTPVCTFQSELKDDGDNVTCVALDRFYYPLYVGYYQVNLKYPPQSAPNISKEPTGGDSVKSTDVIICRVSGGKPPVSNVTLKCQLPGAENEFTETGNSSDGQSNVSSSVMFNKPLPPNQKMTCNCGAFWAPRPELYTNSSKRIFRTIANRQSGSTASELTVAAMIFVAVMMWGI